MQKSLQLFMDGLIDYAGLFPPSALDMDTAIRNYAEYRLSNDKFMLSHFICPSGRLKELEPYGHELFIEEPPFLFSVLCGGAEGGEEEFLAGLEKDFEQLSDFCEKHDYVVKIGVLEIKLPALSGNETEFVQLLNRTARLVNARMRDEVQVFYEIKRDENWSKNVEKTARALSAHNHEMQGGVRYLQGGFKLRCGGVKAEMVPTVEQVSAAVYHCAENNIALKATAGLHHPVRHFNESVQTRMHGFFNVFGAVILAGAHQADEKTIREVISEENPAAFQFDEQYFSWKNYKAPLSSIEKYRLTRAKSFGSCSFDEPREDLQNLELM